MSEKVHMPHKRRKINPQTNINSKRKNKNRPWEKEWFMQSLQTFFEPEEWFELRHVNKSLKILSKNTVQQCT
eukprot:UN00724